MAMPPNSEVIFILCDFPVVARNLPSPTSVWVVPARKDSRGSGLRAPLHDVGGMLHSAFAHFPPSFMPLVIQFTKMFRQTIKATFPIGAPFRDPIFGRLQSRRLDATGAHPPSLFGPDEAA